MIQTTVVIVPGTVANIDTTVPVINGIAATPSEDEASISVTLHFTEEQSGIKTVNWQYKDDTNEWTQEEQTIETTTKGGRDTGQTTGPISKTFGDLKEGTSYTFKATVTDVATNTSGESDEASATTVQPTITPSTDIIGDYVNYPIDINNNSKTTDDWRVFYVGPWGWGSASGRIFLIAADYVASTCEELSPAISNSGMIKYSNNDYETYYWSSAPGYHCNDGHNKQLNNTNAQCSFPELFMPENLYCSGTHRYFCSDHTHYANSRCASRLQCTVDWKTFAKEGYAECAIGGPTLNMWVASWNTKHGNEPRLYATGQNSTYGYYLGTSASARTTEQNLSSCTNGYSDTLYFPHKNGYNDLDGDQKREYCYGYWLASPAADGASGSDLMNVYYDGVVSGTHYGSDGLRGASCSLSKI